MNEALGRRILCPCGQVLRYRKYGRVTVRTSARNVLRRHLLEVHPEYRVRKRSLILDEAVRGL